jgi:hypothetical protein
MGMEPNLEPEPEINPELEREMNPRPDLSPESEPESNPETKPKICPRCSAKNNPEFTICWKCQHSFLPWSKRVWFWAEGISLKLISFVRHLLNLLGVLLLVGLGLFCWGLVSQVILGEMTTGQYIHKISLDLKQSKQIFEQAVMNEWRGPILESFNRITIVGGNGSVRKYFGNGCLKSEIPYRNGEREGMARLYHENGRVKAEGLYKNGKLVGRTKEYYDNGFLKTDQAGEEVFGQTDVGKPAQKVRAKTETLWEKFENITTSQKVG